MTPRELPKYEVLFSPFVLFFLFDFLTWLAGSGPFSLGERIRLILKSFPKPLPVQFLKDRDNLSQ